MTTFLDSGTPKGLKACTVTTELKSNVKGLDIFFPVYLCLGVVPPPALGVTDLDGPRPPPPTDVELDDG